MADNFSFKKYLVENKLGPYSRLREDINSQIDVRATLKALQMAVKSGAQVTIGDQPVAMMKFVDMATLENGERVKFPMDPQMFADIASEIMVDGQPLQLVTATVAPRPTREPKPFDPSVWTDRQSDFYRGGD